MGNTILFGTFWVVLIIGSASGDFTKVNVTKSNLNDTKTFLTNATITAPPPPDVTNRTSSLIQSRNQSELELPEISNPPPKAIRFITNKLEKIILKSVLSLMYSCI